MNRIKDFKRFSILMAIVGEATPGEKPSPEKIEIYYRCLEDMSYEVIERNTFEAVKKKGFFPLIPDIRNEPNSEAILQADIELIENLCLEFIFPDFPQTGRNIVIHKLEEMKKEYLVPLVDRFGAEIVNGTNPSATRAQMLRAHKAEMEMKLLPKSEEFKELKVTETIESRLKRIGGRD